MKYLYDYECEKKNLSTRSELDAAIEGNKREGRRASGQYDAQAALSMVSFMESNIDAQKLNDSENVIEKHHMHVLKNSAVLQFNVGS